MIWDAAAEALHRGVVDALGETITVRPDSGASFSVMATFDFNSELADDDRYAEVFIRLSDLGGRVIAENDILERDGYEYRVIGNIVERWRGLELRAERVVNRRSVTK